MGGHYRRSRCIDKRARRMAGAKPARGSARVAGEPLHGLYSARELIEAGRVKPLVVINPEPLAALEGVPAVTEEYPDFAQYLPWGPFFGVFVKEGTPEEAENTLVEAFKAGASDEKFLELMDNFGYVPMNISGDEAREFLDRWQSVTAWLLQDVGGAKVSPEELGIPRPE